MTDALLQDIRYALRHLRRAPGFTAAVILTLALGVGANTALVSLLNAVVLRPLPVKQPERLAAVVLVSPKNQQQWHPMDYGTFLELRQRQQVFEKLCAYSGGGTPTTEVHGVLSPAVLEAMTPEYYDILGIQPFLGRFISADDAPSTGEPAAVVVLGHRFWQRHFGGDAAAIGRRLAVEGTPLTIIGIMPPEFRGLQVDAGSDIFVPLTLLPRIFARGSDIRRPLRPHRAIGRLREGVTLEQARAEIETLWPSIQAATIPPGLSPAQQDDIRSLKVQVESVATGFTLLRIPYSKPLYMLVGLTAILLVITCVNLSGLLLARAVARDQQMAIWLALGATRGRLVQQRLVESLLLSVMGTIIALPFAWWATRVLATTLWSSTVPLTMSMTPDARVLSLMSAVAVGCGLIVGVLPAWSAGRRRTHIGLQPARTVAGSPGRWGKVLQVAQVALSLVLLFGAGLFTRSLAMLQNVDSGFRTEGMLWTRLTAQPGGFRNIDIETYYPDLTRQLSILPGVDSVAFSLYFPTYFSLPLMNQPVARTEAVDTPAEVDAPMEVVSPEFFETLDISIVRGRAFTWLDNIDSPPVCIINRSLSKRLFPSGAAIGQRIRIGADPKHRAIEIVGIVTDATIGNLRAPHQPVVFRPTLQEPLFARVAVVNIRTSGIPMAVDDAVRRTVASLGHQYVQNLYPLEEQLDQSLLQERLLAGLSSFFAAVAVLLAFIGLYGLLTYAIARRTREIGVRLALGASQSAVRRMIMKESVVLTLLGVIVGVPCALAAGRVTGALLFNLAPSDPLTLGSAAAFFVVVGSIAGFLPARRASNIDPMEALRSE